VNIDIVEQRKLLTLESEKVGGKVYLRIAIPKFINREANKRNDKYQSYM